jgi:hypothetical protein
VEKELGMEGALWGSLFTESTNPEGFSPLSPAYNGVRSFRPISAGDSKKAAHDPAWGTLLFIKGRS